MESQQNKWVIIFLIYADFIKTNAKEAPTFETAYAKELDALLNSLCKTKFDKNNVDIYIIYGSLNFVKRTDETSLNLVSTADLFQLEPSDIDNVIVHRHSFENEVIKERSKDDLGTFSTQRRDGLIQIFKFIKEIHEGANNIKFILNTWDHGSVFGISKSEIRILQIASFPQISQKEFPNLFKLINAMPENKKVQLRTNNSGNDAKVLCDNVIYTVNGLTATNFQSLFDKGYLKPVKSKDNLRFKMDMEAVIKEQNPSFLFNHWVDENGYNAAENKMLFLKDNILLDEQDNSLVIDSPLSDEILDILTNEELGDAIKEGFGKAGVAGKIDLLVMMNCWMMNLHTIYAIRNSVDYFIAPQGGISEPGYDYKKVIELISNQPAITTVEIGHIYINTCYDFAVPERQKKKQEIQSWSILMANIGENNLLIETELIDSLNKFVNSLLTDIGDGSTIDTKKKFYTLFYARTCFNFAQASRYFQLDLLNLVKILTSYNFDLDNNILLESLEEQLAFDIKLIFDKIIVFRSKIDNGKAIGIDFSYKKYINQTPPFLGVNIFPPNGASIYFPFKKNINSKEHKLFLLNEAQADKLSDKIENWLKLIETLTS